MKRLVPFVFLLLAALVFLSGCGSSSSGTSSDSTSAADSTSAESSLTKSEFIAKADAGCEAQLAKRKPLQAQLEGLARKARAEEQSKGDISDATRRELAQTFRRLAAIAEAGFSELRALGPPKADAAQLEVIFKLGEASVEIVGAYAAALENHQDAKAQALAEKGDAQTRESEQLSKKYGFKVCGSKPNLH
jgi:hypothetical protein